MIFFLLKKYFKRKEIFLVNSIDQLKFEKSRLESDLRENEALNSQFEKELVTARNLNILLNDKSEQASKENEALRNLIEELQKKKTSKNEDIIIEHIFKP